VPHGTADGRLAWSSSKLEALVLAATCGDTPAMRLYRRAGFRPIGEPEPLRPGSSVLARSMRLDLVPHVDSGRRPD